VVPVVDYASAVWYDPLRTRHILYIDDLVTSAGLTDAHPVSLPADPGLAIDDDPDSTPNAEYNRLTGSLK
jgi:hypothetical protein